MLLQKYKESGLLFNSNFLEQTSDAGLFAYRGELVLVEGEVGDDKGHTKPPVDVMRGAVLLADEKLTLLIGVIDHMASLPILIEKYKADFASDMKALIFAVNLKSAVQVEIEGINFVLIPMIQGVPWNETMEELAIEKSEFKGQSPADKVVTMLSELKSYKPKYPTVSLEEALEFTNSAVREGWGAV